MTDEENKGYRVDDRRFAFSEERQEDTTQEGAAQSAPAGGDALAGAGTEEKAEPRGTQGKRPSGALPPITFATFIFSLNSSALIHLGERPDPATGDLEHDLDLARQTVDLLGMLKEKTRGNLTPEEEHLLDAILFDLRMRYIKLRG
ncbi:MAG: DUF1844 domain-containing protein [Pseudomonadota bacterium]